MSTINARDFCKRHGLSAEEIGVGQDDELSDDEVAMLEGLLAAKEFAEEVSDA